MSDASHPSSAGTGGDDADGPSREGPSREGPGREAGAREAPRGFFGRIFDALTPPDDEEPAVWRAREVPSLGNLRRLRVEDVAVPKADIVAVPATIALPDLVEVFRGSGRTRIPVYEGSLDEPLGAVNLKDVALRHGFGQGIASGAAFDLRGMLRPLLYVPPSMPLAALLQRMQAERIHIALVIDEYGGTDGLATIEDLLETVVGDIADEHDVAEAAPFSREPEGTWIAEGAASLVDFEREVGIDLTAHEEVDAEEVDTVGGLVFSLAGRVPQAGEVVEHPDGALFEVLDADTRRIKRLRVRLPPEPWPDLRRARP